MTVLVVEDDFLTALLIEDCLREQGVEQVQIAKTEADAVKAANNMVLRFATFDVDLGEGGSGVRAAAKILRFHDIPAIFITGHPEAIQSTNIPLPKALLILSKPFTPIEFAQVYRKAIQDH